MKNPFCWAAVLLVAAGSVRADDDSGAAQIEQESEHSSKSVRDWLKVAVDGDRKEAALEVLEKMGAAAIPYFIEALKDEDAHTRGAAAAMLARHGPKSAAAVPL